MAACGVARFRFLPTAVLFIAALAIGSTTAGAQGAAPAGPEVSLLYGLSGGPGHRRSSGSFAAAALPAGASPLDSDRNVGTLGVEVGAGIGSRFAVMAIWDQTIARSSGTGRWGTSNIHATARVWLARRFFVEAGGGAAELGYRVPVQTTGEITRFWAPGREAAAGVEIFRGPTVSLMSLVRYSAATFEGLTVTQVSVQVGLLGRR